MKPFGQGMHNLVSYKRQKTRIFKKQFPAFQDSGLVSYLDETFNTGKRSIPLVTLNRKHFLY